MDAVNDVLASSGYTCAHVCLDNALRDEKYKLLFSFGETNITDAYLKGKYGPLCTVRSSDWNKKFLNVRAEDIALLIGNCDSGGELRNITLSQFLRQPAKFGAAYTGLNGSTSLIMGLLEDVQMRFETVFVPMEERDDGSDEVEFSMLTYSNTLQSQEDPRNLILLATSEGLSVQADSTNTRSMMLHMGSENEVNEYWLKVESLKRLISRQEAATDNENMRKRRITGSAGIGIKALRTRSNVLMAVQVPLNSNPGPFDCKAPGGAVQPAPSTAFSALAFGAPEFAATGVNPFDPAFGRELNGSLIHKANSGTGHSMGKCRISRGSFYARHRGLSKKNLQRRMEKVTVTCMIVHAVPGGVPSAADVLGTVADMEDLYNKSTESKSSFPLFGSTTQTPVASFVQTPVARTVSSPFAPTIQAPFASCVQAAFPPSASSKLSRRESMRNIVLAKLKGLESAQTLCEEKLLELRVLALGALRSTSVRTLLESNFNALNRAIGSGNGSGAKELLLELELVIQGSFDLLEMDGTLNKSPSA